MRTRAFVVVRRYRTAVPVDLTSTPPAIELRQLRCLRAIIEERRLDQAADRLRLTPDALGGELRGLEAALAVALVSSDGAGLAPTAAGRVLGDHAREILTSVDRAVADTRRVAGLAATLRVGCVPDLPVQQLQAFIGPLYQRLADLDVEVVHLRSAEQLSRLRLGELHVGIVHDAGGQPEIRTEPVFRGARLVAFVPPAHRLASRATLGPDDLRQERLLVSPRSADPALADGLTALLEREGYAFRDIRETCGAHVRDLLFAVAEGRGIALGPISTPKLVGEAAAIVSCAELQPPLWMPDTTLAWRSQPSSYLALVIDGARAVARELYGHRGPPA
jgi:DNA-binding transcriptional LysR family regulator